MISEPKLETERKPATRRCGADGWTSRYRPGGEKELRAVKEEKASRYGWSGEGREGWSG